MSVEPVDGRLEPDPLDGETGEPETATATSADSKIPTEAGPNRSLLVALAGSAGVLLLWLLFRSVPAADPAISELDAGTSLQEAAETDDPGWMIADAGSRRGAGDPLVPPVYDPRAGEGVLPPDSSALADTSGTIAPAATGAREHQENSRREAFLAALRSKPLQGPATFASTEVERAPPDLPPPPAFAEMQAAAEAEAARRSSGSDALGGFQDAVSADAIPPGPGAQTRSAHVGELLQPSSAPVALGSAGQRAGQAFIPAGTVIEGQLHTAVRSDVPGFVIGMVTRPVYDAPQRVQVIPRFSWLVGTYEANVTTGQARLVIRWTTVRFPGGETYSLPDLGTADRTGATGLRGRVNNHYGTIFGHALLSSVVAAAFVSRGSDSDPTTRTAREASADVVADQLGQTASEVTRRNLDIKPTIVVNRLTPFLIVVDRPLIFTPRM